MNSAVEIYRGSVRDQSLRLPGNAMPVRAHDRLEPGTLFTALRRRIKLFVIVALIPTALTILLTANQTPLYTTTAQVVLNMREVVLAPVDDQKAQNDGPTQDRADTEIEVIRSRAMAQKVGQALNLGRDPRFNPLLQPPTGLMVRIREWMGRSPPPRRPATAEQTERMVVALLRSGLGVTRVGDTYAINMSYTGPDPEVAAAIANEYAREYAEDALIEKREARRNAVAFLARRLDELRPQAQADMARVQQYRIATNLLTTSGSSLTEQEISSYNQAVASARAAAAEDQARLDTARRQLRTGSQGDDVGEALGSGVVGSLRARQADVSGRLAVLNTRYGPRHPDVKKAASELTDVNQQIEDEIGRVISNLDAKARVSSQRLSSLQGSLSSARGTLAQNNRAMTGLHDLEQRASASQELYESYLNRYKQVVAQGGAEQADARVISVATVPGSPSSPRVVLNLMLGIALGLGAGLIAALIAEFRFGGMTTGQDVEEKLDLPFLGSIPLLSSVQKSKVPIEAVVQFPNAAFAESFRGLRNALNYAAPGPNRAVAITSALPRDGKTTTAACLARVIASGGESVVLVDCDVRRRGTSRLFGLNDGPGVIEVLRGETSLEDALVSDGPLQSWILPLNARSANAGDLLSDKGMMQLIQTLKQRYRYVLLDTAPVLPVAETRVLSAMADVVLFVARWRHTPHHAVNAAIRMLPERHVTIAGAVLTQVDVRRAAAYDQRGPLRYYNHYKEYYA